MKTKIKAHKDNTRLALRTVMAANVLLVFSGYAHSAVTQFVGGMSASGTPPFQTSSPAPACVTNGTTYAPGDDACGSDNIVRTNDFVTYRVGFTVSPSDTGGVLTLTTGSFTTPTTFSGALARASYFDVLDLPTGANGCQNISAAPLPAAGPYTQSGVTADGKKLICIQPSPVSGNNQDFRLRIPGDVPNGAVVNAPAIFFQSANNPSSGALSPLSGVVGTETFYGLPPVIVSASPRWNLRKANDWQGAALFVPGSGPAGEDGFIFSWSLGVFAKGSRKGLEAIAGNYTVNDTFNDPDFPNARVLNWNVQVPGFASFDFSATGQNGCGDYKNELSVRGNVFDNYYTAPRDQGSVVGSTNYDVARGGDCVLSSFDNSAKTATYTISGTDFSLVGYPTRRGYNPSGGTLVNASNLDDASNEWWVANKEILTWAPLTDVPTPPNPNTLFLTNSATFAATSITGQSNIEPISTDNQWTLGATRQLTGNMSKYATRWLASNPNGVDIINSCDPNYTGDCIVSQAAPSQFYFNYLRNYNNGTQDLPGGYFCDKLDNARLSMVDITPPGFATINGAYIKDPATGVVAYYLAGSPTTFPVVWSLGVGGTGITPAPSAGGTGVNSGTWTSTNTTSTEYNTPTSGGASQGSASLCADGDATWFSSVAALTTAGYTMQDVSRVRGKYNSFPAINDLIWYVPQKVNSSVAFGTAIGSQNVDFVGPGTNVPAGAPTPGMMSTNQLTWTYQALGNTNTADAVKIFQTEYVKLTKRSPTNPNNSLVSLGSTVSYELVVNFTTSGSAHTGTVEVWDVLPQYLSYVNGSSTLGGAGIADPVCATTGLPTPLFPLGSVPTGLTACKWTLANQTATKTEIGAADGNLPTIAFDTFVSTAAPGGVQLLNSAFADSADNLIADAAYAGAATGFNCNPGVNCAFGNWLLSVVATPGIVLNKRVDRALVPVNTGFKYSLIYGAIGNSLDDVRIVDVLPFNGDARFPVTARNGTLGLAGPIGAPLAAAGPPTLLADPTIIVLYTSNTSADINQADPYSASQILTGLGGNSATTTNWCSAAQVTAAAANCPASYAAVTGVLARPLGGGTVTAGSLYQLDVNVLPAGNARLDVYSNGFTGDSSSLTARRPSSNIVTTTVVQPDLTLAKSVSPTVVTAGQTVGYSLLVKNNTGSGIGPIENVAGTIIRVTDPLTAGLTASLPITATDWNCSASTTTQIDCTFVGALPIGVGGSVGGPISFVATTASTTPNNTIRNNTATVTITGQSEAPSTNNTATASITVLRDPDATITKTVSPAAVMSGSTIIYVLTPKLVSTEGSASGGPIIVTDNLPADVTITGASSVSGTDWNCAASAAPSSVSCTYTGSFPIAAGANIGGAITVTTVAGNVPSTVVRNNSAQISVPGDNNSTNNTATVPVTIGISPGSVSGYVYLEKTVDTTFGGADKPLAGVAISLTYLPPGGGAAVTVTTTTDSNGRYEFTSLPTGATNLVITETQPAGYDNAYNTPGSGGTQGNNTTTLNIASLGSSGSINNNFAETAGSISGSVWKDLNGNNTRDPGEELAGVPMTLTGTDLNGAIAPITVNTDANGNYLFPDLRAGTYTVTEGAQPAGTVDGPTVPGTTGGTASAIGAGVDAITGIALPVGIASIGNNFIELVGTAISGKVYVDKDASGGNTTGDLPIAGVTITLSGTGPSGPFTITTTTDAAGNYTFADPRVVAGGNYTITETQPPGYGNATENPGNVITITNLPVSGSSNNNFGETLSSIAGSIWKDLNNNGVLDAGEALSGVPVTLTGADPNGAITAVTVNTDANGNYLFPNLKAGTYAVTEGAQPLGTVDGPTVPGSTGGVATPVGTIPDSISAITLPAGTASTRNNFIELVSTSIGGKVYVDANSNGTINPTEPGIGGVTITLFNSAGNPIATTVTAADGSYTFSGAQVLQGQNYTIRETQPTNYGDGTTNPGTNATSPAANEIRITNLPATGSAGNNFGEIAPVDLATSTAAAPTGPTSGTFTVTTSNVGQQDAPNVRITTALPPGLAGVVPSNGGTFDSTTGVVTWPPLANLAVGTNVIYTVSVQTTPGATITANTDVNAFTNPVDTVPLTELSRSNNPSTAVLNTALLAIPAVGPMGLLSLALMMLLVGALAQRTRRRATPLSR